MKKMKKARIIVTFVIGSLLMSACGNSGTVQKDTSVSEKSESFAEEREPSVFVRSEHPIEATPNDEPLVICTEEVYEDNVDSLVKAWEALYPGVKADVVVIPQDDEKAELKITSLKTEIMAGEGPDVFILKAKQPTEEGSLTGLFSDPKKAMSMGIFLKLDDYIARAKYMEPSKYPDVIMDAGKNADGQYILPYAYNYTLAAYQTSDLKNPDKLPMSFDEVVSMTDSDIYQNVQMYMFYPQIFTQIADYENDTLLFTEDELTESAMNCIGASELLYDENSNGKHSIYWGMASNFEVDVQMSPEWRDNNAHTFWALPNTDGGVTACINVYTAINSHTKQSENAFSFLDVVYSPQVLDGEGFCIGDKYYANGGSARMDWNNGILFTYGALGQKVAQLSESDKAQLQAIYDRINCARFNTDMDQSLYDMSLRMSMVYGTENEAKCQSIVDETYNSLWMKMAE